MISYSAEDASLWCNGLLALTGNGMFISIITINRLIIIIIRNIVVVDYLVIAFIVVTIFRCF